MKVFLVCDLIFSLQVRAIFFNYKVYFSLYAYTYWILICFATVDKSSPDVTVRVY
jgi:hypothetical protein